LEGHERILVKIKENFNKKKLTLKQLFSEIDKDNSGSISKEEFRKFLIHLDNEITDRVIDDILRYMNIMSSSSIN
jgi:Ca2+-binding EF-hand superfamily protein